MKENKEIYRLNKTENMDSTNVDGYIQVELKNKTKELTDAENLKLYDAISQYEQDRLDCTNYRFIMQIEPIFNNDLYNMTGQDGFCIFGTQKFLDSGFGSVDNNIFVTLSVNSNNYSLGLINRRIDSEDWLADFVGVQTDILNVTYGAKNVYVAATINTSPTGTNFVCWKKNGEIQGPDGTNFHPIDYFASNVTQVSSDTTFTAYFAGEVSEKKLVNTVRVGSVLVPGSDGGETPPHYEYYLILDYPVGDVSGGLEITSISIGGTTLSGMPINIPENTWKYDLDYSTTEPQTKCLIVGETGEDSKYKEYSYKIEIVQE